MYLRSIRYRLVLTHILIWVCHDPIRSLSHASMQR